MADDGDDPPDLFGDAESDGADATPDDAGDAGDAGDADAPLDDLTREVRARRAARESDETDADAPADPFEPVEVDQVDDDAVWESFAEGETAPEERVGLGAEAERVDDPDEHVVPKRDFCQRCPHFADPPETACTHQGTTIVEVVDADHFRVQNCPVAEDENEDAVPGE